MIRSASLSLGSRIGNLSEWLNRDRRSLPPTRKIPSLSKNGVSEIRTLFDLKALPFRKI